MYIQAQPGGAGDAAQQTRFAGSGTAHHNHKAVDGFIHIQQFNADAHLMLMVVQHSAGKCKHLGGHIDDSAVRQQLIAHAGAVQVSTVGGAKVIQFIVAVLIHHLAVVAGNTVAGQLHIAVLAAADQDAALAAHIQLPQHGGVGRFPPQGGEMQLEVGKIYEGKVTGITKFGAFVELDAFCSSRSSSRFSRLSGRITISSFFMIFPPFPNRLLYSF